jgi:hypothetical protein
MMLRPPQFLAAHLDALVFLVFLIVTGIFRLLAGKAQQARKPKNETEPARTPSVLEQSAEEESDQERIRRFLEALGQPSSAPPPPRVKPRPAADYEPPPPAQEERARTIRPRNILNPLPPLTSAPPPLPRKRIQLPGQMTELPDAPADFRPVTPAANYEVQETTAPPAPPPLPAMTAADAYAAVTKALPPTAVVAGSSNLVANLLRSPDALRQAVLLREILGPPRSLSPFEWA